MTGELSIGQTRAVQYYVQGSDGKEYGPVDFATLQDWAKQRRVFPESTVRDALAGVVLTGRQVQGLFPDLPADGSVVESEAPPSRPYGGYETPPSPYPRDPAEMGEANYDRWALAKVIGWNVLGLVLHYGFGFIGFIITGWTLFDGFRMKKFGHPHAYYAIAIGGVCTLVLVANLVMGS